MKLVPRAGYDYFLFFILNSTLKIKNELDSLELSIKCQVYYIASQFLIYDYYFMF